MGNLCKVCGEVCEKELEKARSKVKHNKDTHVPPAFFSGCWCALRIVAAAAARGRVRGLAVALLPAVLRQAPLHLFHVGGLELGLELRQRLFRPRERGGRVPDGEEAARQARVLHVHFRGGGPSFGAQPEI